MRKMLLRRKLWQSKEEEEMKRQVGRHLSTALPITLSAILSIGGLSTFASASEYDSKVADGWHLHLSPYLWAAGLKGDLGAHRIGTHSVESTFRDTIKKVHFSAMIMGEARKGSVSLLGDLLYINGGIKHGLPAPIPAKEIKVSGNVLTTFLGGGYTLYEGEKTRLDLLGGARLWHADLKVGLYGGPMPEVGATVGRTWVDLLAGFRGRYFFNDQISLTTWALAGGGGASKDWDLAFLANYNMSRNLTITAGYRAMGVNYQRKNVVYNIRQKGPMVGLTYHF